MEDALAGLEGRTWSKALREYEQKLANWCDAGTSEMQPSVRKHYAAAPAKLRTRYLEYYQIHHIRHDKGCFTTSTTSSTSDL